jgi:cytochrome oxidase Cu insertion factor (SCO1/SenC/PrrC family)
MNEMNEPLQVKRAAKFGKRVLGVVHGRHARATLSKILVLAILVFASAAVEAQIPSMAIGFEHSQQQKPSQKVVKSFICPMHPEVRLSKRGKCPKCGMALRLAPIEAGSAASPDSNATAHNDTAVTVAMGTNPASASESLGSTRKMVIPDVDVLDQNGNQLHFYSDLIKGKTVVINFIFTNCTTICPPLAATFARVQKEMGDKVGRDVHFISISVDPLTDTPERLKAWGAKFKAGPGWTFVTGDKQEIGRLLSALGASVARREDHSPAVLIGNDLKGVWTRTYGLAKTTQMVGLILNVMEGKAEESLAKEPGKQ